MQIGPHIDLKGASAAPAGFRGSGAIEAWLLQGVPPGGYLYLGICHLYLGEGCLYPGKRSLQPRERLPVPRGNGRLNLIITARTHTLPM